MSADYALACLIIGFTLQAPPEPLLDLIKPLPNADSMALVMDGFVKSLASQYKEVYTLYSRSRPQLPNVRTGDYSILLQELLVQLQAIFDTIWDKAVDIIMHKQSTSNVEVFQRSWGESWH